MRKYVSVAIYGKAVCAGDGRMDKHAKARVSH